MLSEGSLTPKSTYYIIHLYEIPELVKNNLWLKQNQNSGCPGEGRTD